MASRRRPSWRTPEAIVIGGVLGLVALIGVIRVATQHTTHTLTGSMSVYASTAYGGCDLGWGYSDISAGTDVVVTNDDTGRTIAIGQLEDGSRIKLRLRVLLQHTGCSERHELRRHGVASRNADL